MAPPLAMVSDCLRALFGRHSAADRISNTMIIAGWPNTARRLAVQAVSQLLSQLAHRYFKLLMDSIMAIRTLRIVSLVLLFLSAGLAAAAEITLFERPDFRGRSVTLRGVTPGFDRSIGGPAASIIVRSGRWQLCADSNFAENCGELGPGQYGRLERVLPDRVVSARPVQYSASRPPAPPRPGPDFRPGPGYGGEPSIQLFERHEFGGKSVTLTRGVPNFDPMGFNDRADAAIVRGGVWRLCSDAYMRGDCRDFPPGRYNDLGSLGGKVSSAAIVR
jgi:beta/gamma crystallin